MAYLLGKLLSESANRYVDKEAIVFQDKSITYGELEKLTNQLAHALIAQGFDRGDRVGLYLNKSIDSVVAIFGILKAGAVYVPLDTFSPAKRLSYIIRNCGIRCLITSSDKIEDIKQAFPGESPLDFIIILNDDELDLSTARQFFTDTKFISRKTIFDFGTALPENDGLTENNLAYILYTSGSTGEPKGVMISHRNALTFIDWAYEKFYINVNDRVSNHAPLHFDLSIFDIFATLKTGATLVIVPEWLSAFPITLAEFIEKNKITVWYSVPSVLTMLVLHGKLNRFGFTKLRLILFAGEVFPIKYLRELINSIPRAEYYNLYGPTETNVCTYYHVKEIPPNRFEPVPIGKGCENFEVFAIGENGDKIKQGEVGELYVRSPSVAKGYWGLPERTEEVFLQNVFQPYFDDNVYRTGDLVTIEEDGNFIFIGRKDNMIKSRGYRIELGEIETALYSHPKIKEVAVIAIPDELISNKIKAFIVSHESESLSKIELEKYCFERLPKYMIPELIEFRESLPKTSTGKIDKKSLEREKPL